MIFIISRKAVLLLMALSVLGLLLWFVCLALLSKQESHQDVPWWYGRCRKSIVKDRSQDFVGIVLAPSLNCKYRALCWTQTPSLKLLYEPWKVVSGLLMLFWMERRSIKGQIALFWSLHYIHLLALPLLCFVLLFVCDVCLCKYINSQCQVTEKHPRVWFESFFQKS